MWPLVALGGALWWLSRPRRNPDWYTTRTPLGQLIRHPLRAGDGRAGDPTLYDPERAGERSPIFGKYGGTNRAETVKNLTTKQQRLADQAGKARGRAAFASGMSRKLSGATGDVRDTLTDAQRAEWAAKAETFQKQARTLEAQLDDTFDEQSVRGTSGRFDTKRRQVPTDEAENVRLLVENAKQRTLHGLVKRARIIQPRKIR